MNDLTPDPALPLEQTAYAPPAPSNGFFMGPFGLRAGWSILLYLIIATILIVVALVATLAATGDLKKQIAAYNAASAHNNPAAHAATTAPKAAPKDVPPGKTATIELVQFLPIALTAWVMSRIERRRYGVFGIGRNRIGDFFPAAFWGLATLSALIFALHAGHWLVFDERALSGLAVVRFGLEWLFAFLCLGFFEESLFRGYIQFTLVRGMFGLAELLSPRHSRGIAFLIASLFTSAIFFAAHGSNTGETIYGLIAVFLAGVTFTYSLWRTGSLWWGIGFHMAWDWAQSFLYGVPDSGQMSAQRLFHTHASGNILLSGGTVGPEGSILVIPALLLAILAIRFTTRPGAQPPLEQMPDTRYLPSENSAVIA